MKMTTSILKQNQIENNKVIIRFEKNMKKEHKSQKICILNLSSSPNCKYMEGKNPWSLAQTCLDCLNKYIKEL